MYTSKSFFKFIYFELTLEGHRNSHAGVVAGGHVSDERDR